MIMSKLKRKKITNINYRLMKIQNKLMIKIKIIVYKFNKIKKNTNHIKIKKPNKFKQINNNNNYLLFKKINNIINKIKN